MEKKIGFEKNKDMIKFLLISYVIEFSLNPISVFISISNKPVPKLELNKSNKVELFRKADTQGLGRWH